MINFANECETDVLNTFVQHGFKNFKNFTKHVRAHYSAFATKKVCNF